MKIMNEIVTCGAAILVLTGCANTPLATIAQTAASLSPATNTAYEVGQLFCAVNGMVVGVVDNKTGTAWSVIGKASGDVAAACAAVYPTAIPVNTPAVPTAVPAVTIVTPVTT